MNTEYKPIDKETFDNLSAAEKRMTVAQDVINRIRSKKLAATHGNFLDKYQIWQGIKRGLSLKDSINNVTCEACAKGALVCAWIGNFNEFKIEQLEDIDESLSDTPNGGYPPELIEIFGRERLDNIEAAFEGQTYSWHYDEDETSKYKNAFRFRVGDESLIEIMSNIVANNGELVI